MRQPGKKTLAATVLGLWLLASGCAHSGSPLEFLAPPGSFEAPTQDTAPAFLPPSAADAPPLDEPTWRASPAIVRVSAQELPGEAPGLLPASFDGPALDLPDHKSKPFHSATRPVQVAPETAEAQALFEGIWFSCALAVTGWPGPLPLVLANQPEQVPVPRLDAHDGLTFHLDDVETRKALEFLSREASLNLVLSPAITSKVTAHFKGVSIEQALEAILKMCNLVARRENGLIYIYTREELTRAEDDKLPIRVYHLDYVKSTDVEKMVKPLLSPKGKITGTPPSSVGLVANGPGGESGAGGGGSGSPGGAPSGGPSGGPQPGGGASGGNGGGGGSTTGGNSLAGGEVIVVQDRESILLKVDQIVHELDQQPLQVMIEAVILNVNLTKDHEFGVNFAVVDAAGKVLSVVGNGTTLNAVAGFTPQQVLTSDGLLRNPSNEAGLHLGFTGGNVTGFIRAVESLGKVEILATPRLLVLNKQPAELQIGDLLGYSTFSQSLVSTTQNIQFLATGTLLRVRPFISSDGMVRMEVHPERSSGQLVNNIPQTSTSEVTTNVMVPDGATLVIGGLIETVNQRTQNGVPYLAHLPIVGALFRERIHQASKNELIVLLTPRIYNPHGCVSPASRPGASAAPLMTIRKSGEAVSVGEDLLYEIRVVNNGQKPLDGATLSVTFPPGLRPQAADGPPHYLEDHRLVYEPLAVPSPGGQAVYRIRARAEQPGWQRLRAQLNSMASADGVQVVDDTQVLPAPRIVPPPKPPSPDDGFLPRRNSAPR